MAQMQPHAANQAGALVSLRGMTHQSRRLVHDEEIGIFMDHFKQIVHGLVTKSRWRTIAADA